MFTREGSTKSDQATISTHPIELVESTIYGWEGDALNAYIKAKTGQGESNRSRPGE